MYGELEEELFEGKGKSIFNKYKPTMEKVLDERVFFVTENKGKFYLVENCDQYFGIELTPEICIELSSFFKDLSDFIPKDGENL